MKNAIFLSKLRRVGKRLSLIRLKTSRINDVAETIAKELDDVNRDFGLLVAESGMNEVSKRITTQNFVIPPRRRGPPSREEMRTMQKIRITPLRRQIGGRRKRGSIDYEGLAEEYARVANQMNIHRYLMLKLGYYGGGVAARVYRDAQKILSQ